MTFDRSSIDTVIFDFDGVLTDNYVYINDQGSESVRCSRSDGLGFNMLKALKLNCFILSTETNPVVLARAKKLGVDCFQGHYRKHEQLIFLESEGMIDLKKTLFIGNDINDIECFGLCAFSACPIDAKDDIQRACDFVIPAAGGDGVARALVEQCMQLNGFELLYKDIKNVSDR